MGRSCNKGALNRQQISKQGRLQRDGLDVGFARRPVGVYFFVRRRMWWRVRAAVATVIWGIVVVSVAVVVAVAGLILVQRLVPSRSASRTTPPQRRSWGRSTSCTHSSTDSR